MSQNQENAREGGELPDTNDSEQSEGLPEMETDVSNAETAPGSDHSQSLNGQLAEKDNQIRQKVEFKGKCHNCGQKGHKSTSCKKPYNRDQTRRRCYQCGKPGHIAKQCKQRLRSAGPGLHTVLTNCQNLTINMKTGRNSPKEN